MPSHVPHDLRKALEPIRLLVLDVDGVLTDGVLMYGSEGEALKRFHVRDGLAIWLLHKVGVRVEILSGRTSGGVAARCRDLKIPDNLVIQGSRDKDADLDRIVAVAGVEDAEIAAMGDDLQDLPRLARAGFAACPADAVGEVQAMCAYVCRAPGGHGAVREVAELILKAQRRWLDEVGHWLEAGGRADDA